MGAILHYSLVRLFLVASWYAWKNAGGFRLLLSMVAVAAFVILAAFHVVMHLAVRSIDSEYIIRALELHTQSEFLPFDPREFVMLTDFPNWINSSNNCYKKILDISHPNSLYGITGYINTIQILLNDHDIIGIKTLIDRSESTFFSGGSLGGPDAMSGPKFVRSALVEEGGCD